MQFATFCIKLLYITVYTLNVRMGAGAQFESQYICILHSVVFASLH
jgi:hypothetical protein